MSRSHASLAVGRLLRAFNEIDQAPTLEDMRNAMTAYSFAEQCVIVGYGIGHDGKRGSGWWSLLADTLGNAPPGHTGGFGLHQ